MQQCENKTRNLTSEFPYQIEGMWIVLLHRQNYGRDIFLFSITFHPEENNKSSSTFLISQFFFFLSFLADCVELLPPTNGTKFFFRRRKLFFWFGWKKSKKNRKWSSRLFFLGKFCFFSPQKSTSLLLLVQMTKKNLSANAESFCLPRWLFFETKRKRKSPFIFGIHSRGVQCRRKKTEEGKKTLRFLHLDFFTHKMLYRAKKKWNNLVDCPPKSSVVSFRRYLNPVKRAAHPRDSNWFPFISLHSTGFSLS